MYPESLCKTICEGILKHNMCDGTGTSPVTRVHSAQIVKPHVLEPGGRMDKHHEEDGAEAAVFPVLNRLKTWNDQTSQGVAAWDDVTGGALDAQEVLKARQKEMEVMTKVLMAVDIIEIYSQERIIPIARKFGLKAGIAMDLMTGRRLGTT